MVYDITDPLNVMFQGYVNDRDFALTDAQLGANESLHLGPEGFVYVAGSDSPTGQPLLIAANEISGTVSIYTVPLPSGLALSLLGFAVLGLVAGRRRTG